MRGRQDSDSNHVNTDTTYTTLCYSIAKIDQYSLKRKYIIFSNFTICIGYIFKKCSLVVRKTKYERKITEKRKKGKNILKKKINAENRRKEGKL